MPHLLKLLLATVVALVTACASTPQPDAAGRPKLVVLLVVDGFPQRQLVDYREQLAPDGFRRFLDRGAWFAEAHYGHAFTVTAAGHAVMLTGAYPHRTGIIGNDWRDRETNEIVYNTGDTAHTYIGHKTGKLDGTSPRNLRVETVGDVLKRVDPASKVIAISGKDRGAILPGGKSGTAYMYQAQTGRFASSTYYMKEHPAWVEAFNAKKPADAFFHREWTPLLGQSAYAQSLPDEQKWFRKGGKLPMKLGEGQEKAGPLFYGSLLASPYGDELTLAFARAAIEGEGLGRDASPDILSVSLSGHDYINHAFGAESRLSHDHVLHLDRHVQEFIRYLDATVGKDSYVVAFTADHGFMPAPEHSLQLGRAAGRQSGSQTLAKLNGALNLKYGEGNWIRSVSALGLLFDRKLLAERNIDVAEFSEEVRRLVLQEPGIAAAYTRAELESGSRMRDPYFEQVRRTWNRDLSGDLQLVLKPYWMLTSSSSMTTHGSPHPYDTHVPLAFYGPAWVRAGRIDKRVEVADLAPTLAAILGVPPPSAAEGRALPLR